MPRWLAILAAAFVLAGCGGAKPVAAPTTGSTTTSCRTPAAKRALARLRHDLDVLEAAGQVRVKNRLIGGPAANKATDRFLLDLAKAPVSNLTRNRLIDFAARSVVAYCQQCFQALEAERPIPSIAHDSNGASC